jgi:uncharacterized membrane protein YdjX (TVP38/TMEM64 family)
MRWTLIAVLLLALILIPFFLFEDQFNALADNIVRGEPGRWYAAFGIVGLLASDVFLPIPSSIVAAAAGVLLGFSRGAAAVWTGMMLSCVFGYGFGSKASNAARRFVGEDGMARASSLAARYGDLAIVLCRPVPVLAEATVIFAGIMRRPLSRFLHLTVWSNLGIALGYAAIGAFSMRVESFLLAFLGSIALPALALLASRLWLGGRTPGSQ